MRFNAITFANRVKASKDKDEAANIYAEELSNIINSDLATKQDITMLDNKFTSEIEKIKNEMIIKLGSVVVVCTFIISMMIGVLGFLLHK